MTLPRKAASGGLSVVLLCLCVGCAGPRPRPAEPAGDRQVAQASSAARLAYELGEYEQARTLYRRALTRAQAIDAADLAADAAFNLAMSEIGLQRYEAADELLLQAEYDAARASSGTIEIRLLRAKVAYLRGRLPEARALADEVLAAQAPPRSQLQARILRGQMFCDTGDLASAKAELRSIESRAADPQLTPSVRADVAKLQGTVARMEANREAAARLFDTEAQLLRSAHRYRDMGYAYARAAEAHLAAGRPALAADRFFLAARSLKGLGDLDTARGFAESGLSAAEKAGDAAARARARLLLEEIARGAGP
jgi:tetratricopeptide (TPR) repeat protein